MILYDKQFFGVEEHYFSPAISKFALLPVPYEGAVSYGKGTAKAPRAVIEASYFLELYDEVLKIEPYKAGISTLSPISELKDPQKMHLSLYHAVRSICDSGKFPIILGGDHSISSTVFRALTEFYPGLACIQIDAHADLRDEYEGNKHSHACVMARIREMTSSALQIGIRSMSVEEAELIKKKKLLVCTMNDFRNHLFDINYSLQTLDNPVYITFDVDALDWSIVASTGTPEPGGFYWDEIITLLFEIFKNKNVIGFDIVELSYSPHDRNSPFAVAKLIYKMMGFQILFDKKEKNNQKCDFAQTVDHNKIINDQLG